MSTRTGPNINLEGLILNLDFLRNDSWNIGRSKWYDLSTENNDANLVGNPAFNNSIGYFEFNNTEQFAQVDIAGSENDFDFGTDNFTIEVWLYPLSFQFITNIIALTDNSVLAIKATATTGELYVESNSFTTQGTITGWNLINNEWNCVTIKRQAGVLYAYHNGIFIGSQTNFTNEIQSDVFLIRNSGDNQFNPSRFRVVRAYNRALSDQEVRQNYKAFEKRKYTPIIPIAVVTTTNIAVKDEIVGRNIAEFKPVTAVGGVGDYSFSISPNLPAGVILDSLTGFISGFATDISSQTYTITVADQLNFTASSSFQLNVNAEPITFTTTTPSVTLSVNTASSFRPVLASGGFGNLSYSISPALPVNQQSEDIFQWSVTNNNVDGYTFNGPTSGDDITISVFQGATLEFDVATEGTPAGQESFTTPGTYTFTVPSGVSTISAVAVGGGGGGSTSTSPSNGFSGGGGGGGGLGWATIPVTPGETLSVVVGAGGSGGTSAGSNNATSGGDSFIDRGGNYLVEGEGGTRGSYNSNSTAPGGGFTGGGGGNGGSGGGGTGGNESGGGGGAGGYSGNGGNGGTGTGAPTDGSGGGGGGHSGTNSFTSDVTAGGGGVGILGEGPSGTRVDNASGTQGANPGSGGIGKEFGGGGSGAEDDSGAGAADGGNGAVRIIWGPGRSYPSSLTEDQQESGSPEPFWIKTTATTGTGDAVPGVVNNGATQDIVVWDTTDVTPGVYFYNSENSSSYSSTINILEIPPSLSLDTASGIIEGTPNNFYNTIQHTITVEDELTPPQQETFNFDLTITATPLLANADLPSVQETTNAALSFTPVTGSGGITPYNFSISPALPSGLSFNTSTGEITGNTGTETPAITYTVTITDLSNQSSTATFDLEIIGALYQFTSFTFTTGGATEQQGPTLTQLLNSYDTSANPWLNDTQFFNINTQGIQEWTVPATATYRFQVVGATGSNQNETNIEVGEPADIRGDLSLTQGDVLKILVGQEGWLGDPRPGWGGGGGSFVTDINDNPLFVAGGTGGPHTGRLPSATIDASLTTSGNPSQNPGGEGTNGNGGTGNGGGGAGLLGDGQSSQSSSYPGVFGIAFVNGGQGGNRGGGFGGGGGCTNTWGGGGGGYSGGASGNSSPFSGGGGGSFITSSATNTSAQLLGNVRTIMNPGSVFIQKL